MKAMQLLQAPSFVTEAIVRVLGLPCHADGVLQRRHINGGKDTSSCRRDVPV